MFLRFIKLLIKIFLAFTVISFAIIVPVDIVNVQSVKDVLEKISWTKWVSRLYDAASVNLSNAVLSIRRISSVSQLMLWWFMFLQAR